MYMVIFNAQTVNNIKVIQTTPWSWNRLSWLEGEPPCGFTIDLLMANSALLSQRNWNINLLFGFLFRVLCLVWR